MTTVVVVVVVAGASVLCGTGGATAATAAPGTSAPTSHAPGAPTGLTVDDDAAPLAVTGAPSFGWIVHDADRGSVQRAYQLVVTDAPRDRPHHVVFDSGRVESNRQSYVQARGISLAPDHRYWWTVRTEDASGAFGPYASDAHFDTGLGDADWHASWIRQAGAQSSAFEHFALVRREVTITASPVVRARVYAAAGQQFELRVNGSFAAHGPSFSYPDEQYYETTDVTALLHAGAPNAFAFVTHWSTEGQGRPAEPEAFIARITVDHADGSRQVFTSDSSWRATTGPWIQGHQRNDEGDFVEHMDERLVPVGWDEPGFDDRSWMPARVLGPHPWTLYRHLVAARTHVVEQTEQPRSVRAVGSGYVADFGKITAATPDVAIRHGVAGRAVRLVAGDLLDPDGHVSTTSGTQQTDMHWDFDERDGVQELRPFGYLGFRYLEVVGAQEPLDAHTLTIAARHASLPDEHAARFHTGNATLDAVWDLARNTALNDVQEQFLDTPTREKGQFLGDSYDVSQATMAAFGERASTYQALRDFARSQARYWPNGAVNAVYPNGDGKRDIPDYTEDYVQWVWRYWLATGDRATLATLYPAVRNVAGYLARAIDSRTGLVTDLPGGGGDYEHGMVDWPPQMRYGYDMDTAARTTLNVLAADDFRRVAALAGALGRPASEVQLQANRADALTRAIRQRLERADGLFVDGLHADGTQSAHASQQANAFALAFGMVPAAHVPAVVDHVAGLKTQMGVMNYRVLLDAFHAAGRDDLLVTALTDPDRPGYAQILREGATFAWESWDARQTGDSESHGWGATVLAVLQEDVLGVHVTAPGAARVDVRVPKSSPATAAGVVATQRGPVEIRWARLPDDGERIELTVPANATATVHLPRAAVEDVSEQDASLDGDPGLSDAHAVNGEVVVTAGSGRYVFATTPPTRRAGSAGSTAGGSKPFPLGIVVVIVAVGAVAASAGTLGGRRRRRAS